MRIVKIALTILGSAVFAALLSVTVYIMVCGCIGKTASIFGYSVLKVVSGSMEPSIHEGDYIYIKRTDTDSLKAGDIISFYSQDDSIKGEINTHRISEVLSDGTFVTKGDANKIEDSVTVQKASIIGKYYGKLRFFITSPILMMLLEERLPIKSVTVMVQKEAGTRLCAPMGTRDMGAVTVAINYFSAPKLLFNVSRGSFMPSPNVDSCVVRFDIRDKTPEGVTDEKFFFKVARGAFSQRRKTLSNSVSSSMGIDKSIVNQAIEQSDLPASVRPEALSMEQFITFSEALRKLI